MVYVPPNIHTAYLGGGRVRHFNGPGGMGAGRSPHRVDLASLLVKFASFSCPCLWQHRTITQPIYCPRLTISGLRVNGVLQSLSESKCIALAFEAQHHFCNRTNVTTTTTIRWEPCGAKEMFIYSNSKNPRPWKI